jgi:hypothetical protein
VRLSGSQPEPSHRPLLAVGLLGLAAGAGAALLLGKRMRPPPEKGAAAAQGLMAGSALLALAVATDSGLEHYRARYRNRAMFVAPLMSTLTLAAACQALSESRRGRSSTARFVFAGAMASGTAGLAFHFYNVGKREGGFAWLNVFYAAPLGAPAALGIAGLFGLLGQRFASGDLRILGRNAANFVVPAVAVALAGTAAEAGLFHFRGAFQNPAMYAPVTIPPLAAAATALAPAIPAAAGPARYLLAATGALGFAGPLFHAYGVHRNMGGWRNWSQMLLQGPPLPAPIAFIGLATAGVAVLPLIEREAA